MTNGLPTGTTFDLGWLEES